MYSPFSLLHHHMGSMLNAFEHETFPSYGGSQRGYRGYQRQPDLYRSIYEPSPYYVQPHYHLIDVSLPVPEPEEEHDEMSVEEQLRAQLAQQKANAASSNVKANNKQQSTPPQASFPSAMVTGSHNNSQQQVAARDEATEQNQLNSLFRSLFRPSSSAQSLMSSALPLPAELQPLQKLRVDVSEDDSGMTVKAEIAGLSKEDVQLTVKDHVLTIAASKQSQKEQHAADGNGKKQQAAAAGKEPAEEKVKEGADNSSSQPAFEQAKSPQSSSTRILHRELYGGRVSRSLRLPRQAELSAISASCKDGLLTVRVPYKQSKEPEQRTIAIN